MNKNIFLRAIALLSISASLLLSSVSCASATVEMPSITETYTLEKQDIENYISVSGSVEGSDIVKITSDITAKVASLNVEVGSSVKKGDVLCVFDTTDLQSEYDNLKNTSDKSNQRQQSQHNINQRNYDNAVSEKQTALAQAQRAVDNAINSRDKAYNKYNDLGNKMNTYYSEYSSLYDQAYAGGELDEIAYAKSQEKLQQYESAKAEYESIGDSLSTYDNAVQDAYDAYAAAEKSADAAIQAAKDVLNAEQFDFDDSTNAQLEKLQEKIDKCTVTAPQDGIITSLNVAVGSIPSSEAIMTIEKTSSLRIKATINEADILKVHEGQKAIITTSATGKEEFSGKVARVVNIMSGQYNNVYTGESEGGGYSAEIEIDPSSATLLIGMNAKIKIILDEKRDVFAVPYDSIIEEEDGSYSVYIAEENGEGYTAHKISIEKGLETNYLTEIISSELKDGSFVITNPDSVFEGKDIDVSVSYYDNIDGE